MGDGLEGIGGDKKRVLAREVMDASSVLTFKGRSPQRDLASRTMEQRH